MTSNSWKKVFAAVVAVTSPIWVIPALLLLLAVFVVAAVYEVTCRAVGVVR